MGVMRGVRRTRRGERGQVLVIFTIAAVSLIAMVGLVIDGGFTFVQRRDQQNVADAAAMAAGYAYVNSDYDVNTAKQAGIDNATANGYANGTNGVSVSVDINSSTIVVNVTRPHQNYFAGIVGFPSWNVSTTATTVAGVPNQAVGAMPLIFNQDAVDPGKGGGYGAGKTRQFDEPGTGNADVPTGTTKFNWTVFCTANGNSCNGNSNQVDDLISGHNNNPQTVDTSMNIGPLNAGSHTTLFSDLASYVTNPATCFPVAIVNDAGTFQYLASFCITGSVGGSTKQISGYFQGPIEDSSSFSIVPGVPGGKTALNGVYVVKLTN